MTHFENNNFHQTGAKYQNNNSRDVNNLIDAVVILSAQRDPQRLIVGVKAVGTNLETRTYSKIFTHINMTFNTNSCSLALMTSLDKRLTSAHRIVDGGVRVANHSPVFQLCLRTC